MLRFVSDILLRMSSAFYRASIWCRDAAIAVLIWMKSREARR